MAKVLKCSQPIYEDRRLDLTFNMTSNNIINKDVDLENIESFSSQFSEEVLMITIFSLYNDEAITWNYNVENIEGFWKDLGVIARSYYRRLMFLENGKIKRK